MTHEELLRTVAIGFGGLVVGWFAKIVSDLLPAWLFGPRLYLSFEDDGNHKQVFKFQKEDDELEWIEYLYCRIRVRNTRKRIATKCQGYLIGVEILQGDGTTKPTNYADSIPLIWSHAATSETIDIPNGVNRYLDVLKMDFDEFGLEPQFRNAKGEVVKIAAYDPLFDEIHNLRFTILVAAQDAKPRTFVLDLKVGSWPHKFTGYQVETWQERVWGAINRFFRQ